MSEEVQLVCSRNKCHTVKLLSVDFLLNLKIIQKVNSSYQKTEREQEVERERERKRDNFFKNKGCNTVNGSNMELKRHTCDVSSFMCSPCVPFMVPNF